MQTLMYIYYEENDLLIGWLEEFSDYRTQGKSLDELQDNLKDIYEDVIIGSVPHGYRRTELSDDITFQSKRTGR